MLRCISEIRKYGTAGIKVYHQTQDVTVCYTGSRQQLLSLLQSFRYEDVRTPKEFLQSSGRELNESYREKMILKLSWRMLRKVLVLESLLTLKQISDELMKRISLSNMRNLLE